MRLLVAAGAVCKPTQPHPSAGACCLPACLHPAHACRRQGGVQPAQREHGRMLLCRPHRPLVGEEELELQAVDVESPDDSSSKLDVRQEAFVCLACLAVDVWRAQTAPHPSWA